MQNLGDRWMQIYTYSFRCFGFEVSWTRTPLYLGYNTPFNKPYIQAQDCTQHQRFISWRRRIIFLEWGPINEIEKWCYIKVFRFHRVDPKPWGSLMGSENPLSSHKIARCLSSISLGPWCKPTLTNNASYSGFKSKLLLNISYIQAQNWTWHERFISSYSNWFLEWGTIFKIEVFNALRTRFGPSKYTSLKTIL